METLLVTGRGAHIKKTKETLCIVRKDAESPEKQETTISPLDLNLIVLSGELSITTGALRLLASHDVGVIAMDGFGHPFGCFLPLQKGMIHENLERQRDLPPKRGFLAAREICRCACKNKAALLQAVGRSMDMDFRVEISGIQDKVRGIKHASSIKELFGLEGMATKIYFSGFKRAIPPEFEFTGRNHHPPKDAINALLSYGYGILYSKIRRAVVMAGLSPYYGVLHSSYKKQEALIYDLIEEFRQPIVDRIVLTVVHQGRIRPDQFTTTAEGCLINPGARKLYASTVMRRLHTEYTYMGRKEQFSRIIERQVEYYAGFVKGEHEYQAFLYR